MTLNLRIYKVKKEDNLIPTDEKKLVDFSKTVVVFEKNYLVKKDEKFSDIFENIQKDICQFKKDYISQTPLEEGEDLIEGIQFGVN